MTRPALVIACFSVLYANFSASAQVTIQQKTTPPVQISTPAVRFNSKAVVRIMNYQNIESLSIPIEGSVTENIVVAYPVAGHGSGLMIDSGGIVVTNAHVVEGARFLAVLLPGREFAYPAKVIRKHRDETTGEDYAFLYVEGSFSNHNPLPRIAPSYDAMDPVFVWGYPIDFENPDPSVVRGIISQKWNSLVHMPQMDAQINPGNSGGPVLNSGGEVIGIAVSARAEEGRMIEGMKFFMPVEKLIQQYDEMRVSPVFENVRRSVREMNPVQKSLRYALAEALVLIVKDKTKLLAGDFPDEMTKIIQKIENIEPSKYGDELADVAALASAFYWDSFVLSCLKTWKQKKSVEDECIQRLSKAMAFGDVASTIDPSINSSSFISGMRALRKEIQQAAEGNSKNADSDRSRKTATATRVMKQPPFLVVQSKSPLASTFYDDVVIQVTTDPVNRLNKALVRLDNSPLGEASLSGYKNSQIEKRLPTAQIPGPHVISMQILDDKENDTTITWTVEFLERPEKISYWEFEVGYFSTAFNHLAEAQNGGFAGLNVFSNPRKVVMPIVGLSMFGGAFDWKGEPHYFAAASFELGVRFCVKLDKRSHASVFLDGLTMLTAYTTLAPIPNKAGQALQGYNLHYDTFHIRAGVNFDGYTITINYRQLPTVYTRMEYYSLSIGL